VSKENLAEQSAAELTPSESMVRAAERVLAAMARFEVVAPIVDAYQREILERHQWRVAREWVEMGDDDVVVLNPDETYLLEESDAAIYFSECTQAAATARLGIELPESCPKLEARDALRTAQNIFLDEVSTVPGLESLGSGTLPLGARDQALTLALEMVAPYMRDAKSILGELKAENAGQTQKPPRMG
jgi:hypothetical protein